MSANEFDYGHLFSKTLPDPVAPWTGLPKYNFIGGHNDQEQIPLEELVYAIILSKQHVRDSISRLGEIGSAIEVHYVIDLHTMIEVFFDRAVHATVTGYEQARREPPLGDRPQQWAKMGIKTTEGVKVSAHLGDWLP